MKIDVLSMLPHEDRCVRSKMGLFIRLWRARHRYEELRPYGNSPPARLRFHVQHLQSLWKAVLSFQKAMSLEAIPFLPAEHFESIYVVSAYVDREQKALEGPAQAEIKSLWRDYVRYLSGLSHEINPFEFSDACQCCFSATSELREKLDPGEKTIDFEPSGAEAFGVAIEVSS